MQNGCIAIQEMFTRRFSSSSPAVLETSATKQVADEVKAIAGIAYTPKVPFMKLCELSPGSERHSPQLTRCAKRKTTGDRGNRWSRARFWDHRLPVISLSRWRVSTRRQTPIYLRHLTSTVPTSSYPFD